MMCRQQTHNRINRFGGGPKLHPPDVSVRRSAMTQLMLFSPPMHGQAELRFVHHRDRHQSLVFPCNATGQVDLDALDERSRNLYLFARALMGRDYAFPVLCASARQADTQRDTEHG
jgi:hypothetical protein